MASGTASLTLGEVQHFEPASGNKSGESVLINAVARPNPSAPEWSATPKSISVEPPEPSSVTQNCSVDYFRVGSDPGSKGLAVGARGLHGNLVSPIFSYLMDGRGKSARNSRDVFKRLADHGVPLENYGIIKKIVAFDLPQWRFFFSRQFERRTIAQVLEQIARWKAFLVKDFLLLPDQKSQLEKWMLEAESLLWQALIEANVPQVGPWKLGFNFVPTGPDEGGQPVYIFPGLRITAFQQETKETREVLIPADEFNDPALCGEAYRKAFKALGIWDLLWKGPAGRDLMSARKPQGWPVFTHNVIPRLYEYLIPYYQEPGHYSNLIDSPGRRRPARFPGKLIQRMLEILRTEHPHVFGQTTVPQLKAVIQRYLDRKAQSTKSTL